MVSFRLLSILLLKPILLEKKRGNCHKQASLTDLLLTVLTLSLSPRDGPITLFLSVHKG